MSRTLDRCADGGSGAPLSREQKRRVCMLARRAWERLGRPGFADQAEDLPAAVRLTASEAFDVWRQDEQATASGCAHLTCAENRLYPELMGHFSGLAGLDRQADYWSGRAVGDTHRRAMWALRREYSRVGDVIDHPEAYVGQIAQARYKTRDLERLSEKQIWGLVFDLRRAAQRRRRHDLTSGR